MKKLFGACSECGKQELFMTEYNCLGMLMKTKNWIVCKNCDYFKNQSLEDNIDSVKNKLLEIYGK